MTNVDYVLLFVLMFAADLLAGLATWALFVRWQERSDAKWRREQAEELDAPAPAPEACLRTYTSGDPVTAAEADVLGPEDETSTDKGRQVPAPLRLARVQDHHCRVGSTPPPPKESA